MNRLGESAEQMALNETTFREVNEGIEAGRHDRDGLVPFVCECGELGCNEIVEVTLREYEQVRTDSRAFLVRPGHAEVFEELRYEDDRYAVVCKPEGVLGDIAEATDPRAAQG